MPTTDPRPRDAGGREERRRRGRRDCQEIFRKAQDGQKKPGLPPSHPLQGLRAGGKDHSANDQILRFAQDDNKETPRGASQFL